MTKKGTLVVERQDEQVIQRRLAPISDLRRMVETLGPSSVSQTLNANLVPYLFLGQNSRGAPFALPGIRLPRSAMAGALTTLEELREMVGAVQNTGPDPKETDASASRARRSSRVRLRFTNRADC